MNSVGINYKIHNKFLHTNFCVSFGRTDVKESDSIQEANISLTQAHIELNSNNSLQSIGLTKKAFNLANEYLEKFSRYEVSTIDSVYVEIIKSTTRFYKINEMLYNSGNLPLEYPSKKDLVTIISKSLTNLANSINNNHIQSLSTSIGRANNPNTMQKLIDGYKQVFECSKDFKIESNDLLEASNLFKKSIYNQFNCQEFSPSRTPGDLAGKVAIAMKTFTRSQGLQSQPLFYLYGQFKAGQLEFKHYPIPYMDRRSTDEIVANIRTNLTCNKYQEADSRIRALLARIEDISFLNLISEKPRDIHASSPQNLIDDTLFRKNAQKFVDLGIIDKNTLVIVDTGHTLPVIKQLEIDENRDMLGHVYSTFKIGKNDYMPAMDYDMEHNIEEIFMTRGEAHFLGNDQKAHAKWILSELFKHDNAIKSRFDMIRNYYHGQNSRIKDQSYIYYGEPVGALDSHSNERGALIVGIDIHRTGYMEPSSLPTADELRALGYNKVVYLCEHKPKHLSLPDNEIIRHISSNSFGYTVDELIKNDIVDYVKQMESQGMKVIAEGIDTRHDRVPTTYEFRHLDVILNTFSWGIGEFKRLIRK